jgi:hypothetical protein
VVEFADKKVRVTGTAEKSDETKIITISSYEVIRE